MARLDGGIFSRPRGKTGGIVFGAARTRQGKVATARQLVPPSNPNTTAQQTQRGKFSEALGIVRNIGADVYQFSFNRAISQLPGFQSLMSLFMNNMDDSFVLSTPPELNLGTIPYPNNMSVDPGASSGEIDISWDNSGGAGFNDGDGVLAIYVHVQPEATPEDRDCSAGTVGLYSDGSGTLTTGAGQQTLVGVWTLGQGPNAGNLSKVRWFMVTSTP